MTKRILSICCAILTLILMMTPFGVRMVFFGEVTEETTKTPMRSFFGSLLTENTYLPENFGVETSVESVDNTISYYYSYFSTMPIGYANFYPLITALLTFILLLMLILGLKRDLKTMIGICATGCVLASALSWFMFSAFSIVGLIIMALHIFICILQIDKKSQKIVTTPESELWRMK